MNRVVRSLSFGAVTGAVLLSLTGAAVIRHVEPLGLDQGLFACVAQAIARGDLPYRDVWDSKPPSALYTYAVAFALPGPLSSRLWMFETLALLASGGTAFLIARRLWDRWAGLLAASPEHVHRHLAWRVEAGQAKPRTTGRLVSMYGLAP